MNHAKTIKGYSSLSQLAEEIGNLRYDKLTEFLGDLAAKIHKDSQADKGRGRPKLAELLAATSKELTDATIQASLVWHLVLPYELKKEELWLARLKEQDAAISASEVEFFKELKLRL
jgi:hypothetical protein